ncbi:hypothetical protein G8759_14410 [Spirosoma aureum]|uniref:Uncharacterized protein n=1 Tax=Spirosoma aureum TaxID=2692134 RepID=A0A6G9AN26_9BACT|nr:hypothetical protein [Spirosoma aureum]QIP13724.1 hypothetical protein G8759_14410 [Spirosoma aureum]
MKTLEIYPAMTLVHLQQQFSKLFPSLRIEPLIEHEVPNELQTLSDLAGHSVTNCFVLNGSMTINELDALFRECYGLPVRILRWMGYAWHDTDDTSQWTLDQQNQKGTDA